MSRRGVSVLSSSHLNGSKTFFAPFPMRPRPGDSGEIAGARMGDGGLRGMHG